MATNINLHHTHHNSVYQSQGVTQCMVWGRGEDGSQPCQIVHTGNDIMPSVSLKSVSQVACGGKHSIVVTGNGEVYTWGWNWHGQLGHGDMRDQLLAQPVRALALARALTGATIVSVAAGKEHSIALTHTGGVYSWGGGREGQLGSGEEELSQPIPRLITKFHAVRVTMLSASGDHSLAIGEGGVVYSWGKGANGRLGHGNTLNYSAPTIVKELSGLNVTIVACGWSHSLAVCAKTSDTSALYTWGKGDSGQLGLGDRLDRLLPTEVCLESDLRVSDDAGIRSISSFQPGRILAVAAGYFHAGLIVKRTDNSGSPTRVYTWGWGEHGQLGHGGTEDEVLPRVVKDLQTLHVTQMACGGAHSMIITHDSELYGFGNAEFGQLGFMKEEEIAAPGEGDPNGLLNSTGDEIGIIVGSDRLCTSPTHVTIDGYKVIRVACGWWHTVAIVLNCTNMILSPHPPAVFDEADVSPLAEEESSERDSEATEDDNDSDTPSPRPNNLLWKLRGKFSSPKSDKERALFIATEEWEAVLANWPNSRTTKRTQTLWRSGIPPNLRKDVWARALGVSPSSKFEEIMRSIHASRSELLLNGSTSETARLISLDVPRTYPALGMFQKDCSLNQPLQDVLEAVAWSNPSLGYCQGMSYLASTLLMYMDTSMSYTMMTVLTQLPLLNALFAMNVPAVVQHVRIFEYLFAKSLPKVFDNFRKIGITSDQFVLEWLMTLFSRALPLEISHRLWDCFIMEGEVFLYRTVVGILKMDKEILETGSFEQCLALVKTFKEFDVNLLFKKIFTVRVPKYLTVIADRLK